MDILALPDNLSVLADLPGQRSDAVQNAHAAKARYSTLDIDRSVGSTQGAKGGTVLNDHFECT